MNRGADRQDVFVHDSDYRKFEWLLGDAAQACAVEVHGYCLMTNHFHLLLHCPTAGLSEVMQSVQFRYAQWFNQRYGRDGPVFRGRFRSVLVTTDAQLVQTSRYIHRNPLSFVQREALIAYRWSSLGPYLGARSAPPWLVRDHLLAEYGRDPDRLRCHVVTDQPGDQFRAGVARTPPAPDRIDATVMQLCSIGPIDLLGRGRGRPNPGRLLAILLCTELRVGAAPELARRYGLAGPSSVRNLARRGRVLDASDDAFRRLHTEALARLGHTR